MKHIFLAAAACALMSATLQAAVVSGKITSDGKGVAGVPVSDGITVVTTDATGNYSINTDKKLGYVFYTLPSGYEPTVAGAPCEPAIWAHLAPGESDEVHNFEIRPVDNRRFDLVVITDVHLADRADDLQQFHEGFMTRIKDFVAASEVPVYTVALGDLSWDRYWYEREYGPAQFMATLREEEYPTLFFPVTGNHDNDPAAEPGTGKTDFEAAAVFRKNFAPSYYSFNLGDAHVVVIDDIIYKNERDPGRKYAKGVAGSRNYDDAINEEQMEWLRQDLALVDKNKPLIVCTHIPVWRTSFDGKFTERATLGTDGEDSEKLAGMMKDFSKVRFLTGHTHYNAHTSAPGYPNIAEDNVSALCTQFWNTKAVGGRMICSDGSPSGFKVYSFDGPDFSSRFEAVEEIDRQPFRVYDLNTVKAVYATDSVYRMLVEKHPARTDYAGYDDNMVLINVFDYQPGYAITVEEDGKTLSVERVTADDPLAISVYVAPVIRKTGRVGSKDACRPNNHMFAVRAETADKPVTITVTDPYGRTATQILNRPKTFHNQMQ